MITYHMIHEHIGTKMEFVFVSAVDDETGIHAVEILKPDHFRSKLDDHDSDITAVILHLTDLCREHLERKIATASSQLVGSDVE